MSVRRTFFFDHNISASIISMMCTYMYTTIPLLIIHFNMQHYMWSFPLLIFLLLLLLSSHLFCLLFCICRIYLLFFINIHLMCNYISPQVCWISLSLSHCSTRQTKWVRHAEEEATKNSWNRKEDRKEAKKRKITLLCMDRYIFYSYGLTWAKSQKKVVCKSWKKIFLSPASLERLYKSLALLLLYPLVCET